MAYLSFDLPSSGVNHYQEKPLWTRARPNSPAYHAGGSGRSHLATTVIATPVRPILTQPSKLNDNNGGSSFPKASYPPAPATGKTRHGNHGRVDHCRKPSSSYNCLIGLALKSSKTGKLPVNEIYAFIQREFPYFRTATESWKNCIRHSLSLGQYFRKVERGGGWQGKKGFLWEVIPKKKAALEREMEKSPAKNHPWTEAGAINSIHQEEGTAARAQTASKPTTTQNTTRTQPQCQQSVQFQSSNFYFPQACASQQSITAQMLTYSTPYPTRVVPTMSVNSQISAQPSLVSVQSQMLTLSDSDSYPTVVAPYPMPAATPNITQPKQQAPQKSVLSQPSNSYFPATPDTITPSMMQPQTSPQALQQSHEMQMVPPSTPAMASTSAVNLTPSQTQRLTLQKSVQPQSHSASCYTAMQTLPQELRQSTEFQSLSSYSPTVASSMEQDLTQPQTFPQFPHEWSVTAQTMSASDLLDVVSLLQMDNVPSITAPFPSIELTTDPGMPSEVCDGLSMSVPLDTTSPLVYNPYEPAFDPEYIMSSQPTSYSTTVDPTISTISTQPPQPFLQQPSSYPSFVALSSDNGESLLNEMVSAPAQLMVWPPSSQSLQQTATLQQVPPILGAHAPPTAEFLQNSTLTLDADMFQPSFNLCEDTDQGVLESHLPYPRSTISPLPCTPFEAAPKLQDNSSGKTSENSTQYSAPLETPTTSDQAMLEQQLEVYLEDILDGYDDSFSDIDCYEDDVGYDDLFSDIESFWVNSPKSPLQELESDTKIGPEKEMLKELDMDPDTTLEFADSLLAKSSCSSKSICARPDTPVVSMENETTSTPTSGDVRVMNTTVPQLNEHAKSSGVENIGLGSETSDEISSVESALSLVGRAENSTEWRALDIDDLVELIQNGGNAVLKNSTPVAAKPEVKKESRKRSAEEAFGDAQPMETKKAKKEAENPFSTSSGNTTYYGVAANFSSEPHTTPPHLEGESSEGDEESALPQCLTMNDDLMAALHLQVIDLQFFSLFSTEDIKQLQTTSN